MFEVTTKAKPFKQLLDCLFVLSDEIALRFTEKGIDIKCMDIDNSGLIDSFWSKDKFTKYGVEEDLRVGVNVEKIRKILARIPDNNELTITLDKRLQFSTKGKYYEIDIIPTDQIKEAKSLKVSYDDSFEIATSELKDKLEDVYIVENRLDVSNEGSKLKLSAKGDYSKVSSELELEKEYKANVTNQFDIPHMLNMLKTIKQDKVTVSIQEDLPLLITFDIPEIGKVKYHLANYANPT